MNLLEFKLEAWSDADLHLHLPETDHMFKIVESDTAESVGSIGYWQKTWHEQLVHEMGWQVLPAFQGLRIATKAGEAILGRARSDRRYQFLHAFPSVSNPASNAICRKLGFTLIEACQVEYPAGSFMLINDWRIDLYQE